MPAGCAGLLLHGPLVDPDGTVVACRRTIVSARRLGPGTDGLRRRVCNVRPRCLAVTVRISISRALLAAGDDTAMLTVRAYC
ncbi:hypothetical protein EEB19_01220 [Gordonia sp. OPL2]|nr:hypothetical protein EEB19_01220 [Gordonia sp. OPL2]